MLPLQQMPCDVLYVRGMRLDKAVAATSETIEAGDYARYVIVADDCVVGEDALRLVVETSRKLPGTVVTGYCNLDVDSELVNITRSPLKGDTPTADAYDFYRLDELEAATGTVYTGFAGMALTCIPREVAPLVTPMGWFQSGQSAYSSDFHLSKRLERAGIPIVAPVGAFVYHVKERWNTPDRAIDKRLHIGAGELVMQRAAARREAQTATRQEGDTMSEKIAEKDITRRNELGQTVVLVHAGMPIPDGLDLTGSSADVKAVSAPPENKARSRSKTKAK